VENEKAATDGSEAAGCLAGVMALEQTEQERQIERQ
jgi:hypothetical protein